MCIRPMRWESDRLVMLDQRTLPGKETWIELSTSAQVADAIRDMVVRGAPAIGIAAAYGMSIAALRGEDLSHAATNLAASRPTAVNLFWALERIASVQSGGFDAILAEAKAIENEDLEMNHSIGRRGAELMPVGANIMTVCNTGSLATAGHGTALGVIRTAFAADPTIHVWSCETRPRLQGLRLTAYELITEGIPFDSIADGAAGSLMRMGKVDCVIAGADRIAANGDTANKIGTYSLAVLAKHHEIPFYIAAPSSTLDPSLPSGECIPIEQRAAGEITEIEGLPIAPHGTPVYNPAFDVTPAELISAIITELEVFRSPYDFSHFGSV